MIGPLRQFPSPRLSDAPLRPRRSIGPGAMLALLAVLLIAILSTWHGTTIHDDHLEPAASVEHQHEGSGQTDDDDPVHVAAHAATQGLIATVWPTPWNIRVLPARRWISLEFALLPGIDPTKLLRPPRA